MFNLNEFLTCETNEIHDWWTDNKLPDPGCPVSFKIMLDLVWACHRVEQANGVPVERERWKATRRLRIKDCIGHLWFINQPVPDKAVFDFPYKNKHILVPLDLAYVTDLQLLDLILRGNHR